MRQAACRGRSRSYHIDAPTEGRGLRVPHVERRTGALRRTSAGGWGHQRSRAVACMSRQH